MFNDPLYWLLQATFGCLGLAFLFALFVLVNWLMARRRNATVMNNVPPGVTLRVERDANGNTRVIEERNTEPLPVEPPSPRREALPALPDEPVTQPSDVEQATKELLDNVYRTKRGRRTRAALDIAQRRWTVVAYTMPQEKEKGMTDEPRPLPTDRVYLFPNVTNVNGAGRIYNPYGETLWVYMLTSNGTLTSRVDLRPMEQRQMPIDTRHVAMTSLDAYAISDFAPILREARILF